MKKFLILMGFVCTLSSSASALAACYGSSPTLTAASASRSDVADCVAASTYGDTIRIPACIEGRCVWSSGITITKDVKILGNGMDSTILTNGMANNGVEEAFFKFVPDSMARQRLNSLSAAGTFEVSGITFTSSARLSNKFGVWIQNDYLPASRRVKIHDNKYVNIHRATQVKGYVHGVFYGNVLIDTNGSYPQGKGYLSFENDRFSVGSGRGWYIEDNIFQFNGVDAILSGAANAGGGYVVRYNTATGTLLGTTTYLETHGNQPDGIYGPQITEVYGNYVSATGASRATVVRGGKNIYMNNVFAVGNIAIWEEYSDLATSPTYPIGRCPENQGVARQTCNDSCICQKVHDSYFINNRSSYTGPVHKATVLMDFEHRENNIVNNPPELVENIEYFNHVTSGFNGTTGVGCGTLANRPATCTPGVGYWATEQSCTDLTGMVGANPATPISGTLYKCVASNTWAAYFTPYTYPHPLRSGVTPSSGVAPPTGFRVIAPQ